MSQPVSPEPFEAAEPHPFEGAEPAADAASSPAVEAKASLRNRYLRLPKRRRPRLVALGAAVVVLGVGAVGAAAVVHHGMEHEGGRHGHFAAGEGHDGEYGRDGQGKAGLGEGGGRSHGHGRTSEGDGENGTGSGEAALAPAPVPAFPADQALAKAVAAVPGGKADAVRVVGQQGGGSAWAVEVIGADGVRHLVTVDGTAGSVTGNSVLSSAADNG
ncbi:hypothetical protein [Kitasatospora sp. GP82]|uniref:hypothetical protein n=1 Tax=Kitasatospora sp. GP82 TaxID=3035089 RepID=UPI002474BE37|nr:hypothetical protein [Kitasatospora sp. GP82]MDH6125376.1 hypothetical protein [Kitasatospora sp. GP82]